MKKLMVIVIALLMLGTSSVLCQNSNELQGVWECIYAKYVFPDSTMENSTFVNPSVKLLTKKHFAFGHLRDNRESISAGGGEYSYNGETYIEHIKYHTYSALVGSSVEFKSELAGDKWTTKGVIPGVDGDIKLKEIWKRIE